MTTRGRPPALPIESPSWIPYAAALQDALSRGQCERLTFRVFDLLQLVPLIAGEVDSLFSQQCRLSGEVPDPARAQTLLLSKGRQGGHRHRAPYAVHGVVIIA